MTINPVLSSRYRSVLSLQSILDGLVMQLPRGSAQEETGVSGIRQSRSTASPEQEPPVDLEGLRRLDPEVISQIHNRFFPDVYRYARYRLNDEALAEDVAGEAVEEEVGETTAETPAEKVKAPAEEPVAEEEGKE